MGTFLQLYKSVDRSAYEKYAMEYLLNDTLKSNLTGESKLRELPGYDMESASKFYFYPSMFYTFQYIPATQKKDDETFVDFAPLILCTANKGTLVSGFNFNVLPNDTRAKFLDVLCEKFPNFYNNEYQQDKFVINEDLAKILINPPLLKGFIDMMNDYLKCNIVTSYRQYSITQTKNIRMIEYDMWKYIPFLSFKDVVRGVNLAELQRKLIMEETEKR